MTDELALRYVTKVILLPWLQLRTSQVKTIGMVGFDPEVKKKLSGTEHGVAGAISGAITRFLCQPLDVIKIRFQLQVEPLRRTSKDSKYWSVTQATRRIIEEEGVSALWKGHVPAQVLSVLYGVVQFVSFEMLTKQSWLLFPHLREDSYRPMVHFVCGGVAGSFATLFSFPPDVVRTRLIAQGEPKVYKNIFQAVNLIYTKEGPRAFFKGLSPTLLQIAPHSGAQFAFYNIFISTWKNLVQVKDEHADNVHISGTGSLICGSLAGICAKTFIYPLDVAKKRIQIQGFQYARKGFGKDFTCHGLLHCLWLTVKYENISGLFKGLWPSMLKAGITTSLHFGIYEQSCQAIAALHR
ncbi:mitochondrial thiamine pyrophosphate carrier-like isoform X2 [Periplaneta americana]|uniref:mitochondrial thiamine pyrophosphate carrier-like isoform X2 n=1 Tax=Periplaneta americana TaxID=6978 RepID=UPI0037E9000A